MSRFFINRPIFAWVIAIIFMLAGVLALRVMAVAQFPAIAPPMVQITTTVAGNDANTLEHTVAQVIEQQLDALDHLEYFSTSSDSAGNMSIILTFAQGTNPDIAQVQVQNALQSAMPMLPEEVQRQGLNVTKAAKNFLMFFALTSTDGSHSADDLGDILSSQLQDPISRVTGVGDYQLIGSEYAMRIWVDPYKLTSFGLTMDDVTNAILAQNAQVSAGQVGSLPAPDDQELNAVITAQTRLTTAQEFRDIILHTNADGSHVLMSDVARVELGAADYSLQASYNNEPAAALAIKLASGANALDTVARVKAKLAELQPQLPPDVKIVYPLDNSEFVKLSIHDVVETLIEAIVLVFLVMFLFLQNWRATLIPTIAVPVVLLGAFAVLFAAGYSLNTLTLFGMVLAIGLLVDDAIVVVENVERLIHEEHLSPKAAALRSMEEISGALVGIAMVLAAVFLPMAFFGGSTGVIFRQFSMTIVISMALSVLVALVLTPALCATILKANDPVEHDLVDTHRKGLRGGLARFFVWFNRTFDKTRDGYERGVWKAERNWKRTLGVYALVVAGMALIFLRIPGGFMPSEDQGFLFTQVSLPAGSSLKETQATMKQVTDYYLKNESKNVEGVFNASGFGFVGEAQNVGLSFVRLKDWSQRKGKANSANAIVARANAALSKIRSGQVLTFAPPAVFELGNADGFDFELKDNAYLGHDKLIAARDQLIAMARKDPRLAMVRANGLEDAPQVKLDVDKNKAGALGLDLSDVNDTLSTAFGSDYVNDFLDRGRVKKVYVEADKEFRNKPDSIGDLYVRGSNGTMTPFSAFASWHWIFGPSRLERYNGLSSVEIMGAPAPGHSSGEAMQAMEELAAKLPKGFGYEWTGLSYEQQQSSGQTGALYSLSLLIVFLCLAALYESWSVPLAVILVVPLGIFGAVLFSWITGQSNDIYLQVGLITTVGVSAKNAILIIEFAEEKMRDGMGAAEAAVEAAKLRLRPILMTSFAFTLGVLPLALSHGAGSGGQNAIGWAVVGGMLSATVLAIFFVPTFFRLVKQLFKQDKPTAKIEQEA
ncbi:efflux RND transporter permease subunit [Novosphingobium sp. 9]|uniref:efflux RND transporter permease subunit n=1 Tax=Novosphingobium sp. 9 TaxID=2025349 RepID=UPI0021B5B12D|nr:efflux RND transporter permease subunit [Novosphingobium sp. 9]